MRLKYWIFLVVASAQAQTGVELFEAKIRPVLVEKCYACHSGKLKEPMGGLRLDRKIEGDRLKGRILTAVSYDNLELKMPPSGKLPGEAIADFRRWIEMGAPDPRGDAAPLPVKAGIDLEKARQFWAFQPVRPLDRDASIDKYLLARLAEKGLKPAPPADRRTWLRRVTFDLAGLPPTPADIDSFLKDNSSEAYEKVVDRLLSSPHYGERWARHWLDLVRYAETNGHEFDNDKLDAWRYRDYAIRAFNQDVPYDQFVREQIAGDLLAKPRLSQDGAFLESPLGTTFYWFGEVLNSATDSEKTRADRVDNQIDVLSKAFLGLTLSCARCHDHKFDPLTQKDYYALAGVMHSTAMQEAVIDSPQRTKEISASLQGRPLPRPEGFEWTSSGEAFEGTVTAKLVGSLTSNKFKMPKLWVHVRMAASKPGETPQEKGLRRVTVVADDHKSENIFPSVEPGFHWETRRMTKEIGRECYFEIVDRDPNGWILVDKIVISDDPKPPSENPRQDVALAEADVPESAWGMIAHDENARDIRLHRRGSHKDLGDLIPRRFLEVIDGKPFAQGSGRLELAERIANPRNPLTARVMANRVWEHHFGKGLVRTADNFGKMGERPTHPELLDFLAASFVANGWSVKSLHRMIVLSNAYRMSSAEDAAAAKADPRNDLLHHFPVRRLEAEAIRDSILAVSGSLDQTLYGPSVPPHISKFQDGRGKPLSGPLDGSGRRSIYIQVRRNFLTPMFLAFDYPLPISTIGQRGSSTVPSQALLMLNNEFIAGQARTWAERITRQEPEDGRRLELMYAAAFARPPEDWERKEALGFAAKAGWADLAHVLFNSAEFIYVR